MTKSIGVLVVDDSAYMRKVFSLSKLPGMVWMPLKR
jgi:hypothetical protein